MSTFFDSKTAQFTTKTIGYVEMVRVLKWCATVKNVLTTTPGTQASRTFPPLWVGLVTG